MVVLVVITGVDFPFEPSGSCDVFIAGVDSWWRWCGVVEFDFVAGLGQCVFLESSFTDVAVWFWEGPNVAVLVS